jgi:hypothetical protein
MSLFILLFDVFLALIVGLVGFTLIYKVIKSEDGTDLRGKYLDVDTKSPVD